MSSDSSKADQDRSKQQGAGSELGPGLRSPTGYVGRGAQVNPANRFDRIRFEEEGDDTIEQDSKIATQWIPDDSKSVVSENNSPDLDFRYSLNPYRGCDHGCSYCYARTYHEYLGYSAGLDFETKIVYKPNVAQRFRQWLDRPAWNCEQVNLSGATDCYQQAERDLNLTRACLEVALDYRQPMTIVTKNALVLRDLDLLVELAQHRLIHVNISITSLDQHLTKVLEPRTSSPQARFRTLKQLVVSGIPTRALLAPIIPGLNDSEIPALLEAVKQTGVVAVGSSLLRLPGAVQIIFLEWLQRHFPNKAPMIESRIRQTRGEELTDTRFKTRMTGEGEFARQIRQTFQVFSKRYGLSRDLPPLNTDDFRRPGDTQMRLFD